MKDLCSEILEIFKINSDIIFGISNIDFSEYKLDYKCALIFAVPHKGFLSLSDYKEDKLDNLILKARDRIVLLLKEITSVLEKHKTQYYIRPVAQSNEETLIAPFSFKFASTNAGIGWRGKKWCLNYRKVWATGKIICNIN